MAETSVDSAEKAFEKLDLNTSDTNTPDESSVPAPAAKDAGTEPAPTTSAPSKPLSLYVGELSPEVTEAILYEIFSEVGSVATIRVCRDAVTRESLGYGYINYHEAEDAQKALDQLNYTDIRGKQCRIMWSQRDPAVRRNGRNNVYIKNLDPTIDNKALHDTLGAFGEILSSKVVTDSEGKSLGFGYVHFADESSADEAIRIVNGMIINDREVYVARHLPRNERESQAEAGRHKFTNVYVKNLDPELTDEGLKELFEPCGAITSAVVSSDANGRSRGFGFVNFGSHESAEKAIADLNDKEVSGRKLYVSRAQTKFERQAELKKQYEAVRQEQISKYQGINLYVKNLDDSVNEEQLREAFAPFGTITSLKIMTDEGGRSRGFGFVCYSSAEEATRAISEMNQHLLANKPLYVAHAQRKDTRQNQMRQQFNSRQQQLLMQQQPGLGGLGSQFMGSPLVYGNPGQFGMQFPGQQMMMPPRGQMPPWQQQGARQHNQHQHMPQYRAPQGPSGGHEAQAPQGPPGPRGMAPSGPAEGKHESFASLLATLPEEQKKQAIGEILYPKVLAQPRVNGDDQLAAKITGMLLDINNDELVQLAEDEQALGEQVGEAIDAYEQFLEREKE